MDESKQAIPKSNSMLTTFKPLLNSKIANQQQYKIFQHKNDKNM